MNRKDLIEYAVQTRQSATLDFVRALYFHFEGNQVEERIYFSGAVMNARNWQGYLKELFEQLNEEVRNTPWPRSSVEEQRISKPTVEGSNPSGVTNDTEGKRSNIYWMGWKDGYDVKHHYNNPFPKNSKEDKDYREGHSHGRETAWDSWGD